MPSGKTHDAVTLLLAGPTFVVGQAITGSFLLAGLLTGAMLTGGFVFGPDLDIQSRQYTRWGVFRFLWIPYRIMFRHRSRWSHGIVFGTFIRVAYFVCVIAILVAAGVYLRALATSGAPPEWSEIIESWQAIETGLVDLGISRRAAWAMFGGLWWGAASHTLTDFACSVARKSTEIF